MSRSNTTTLQLFSEQQELISHFFEHVDHRQVHKFVELALACTGTIFFSGVGKSGFICRKISASLASIGIKSTTLSPLDALHGDIGNVCAKDVLVLFSKSGSTEELIRLVPSARKKGCFLIAVTCGATNPLARKCDFHVHLPLKRELCAFNLAPVTSTVLQLIFGDTVTAALILKTNLTLEKYALNHPAGAIGRKASMCARDIMVHGVRLPIVSRLSAVTSAILEMSRCGIGCVLIVASSDQQELLGIFTDGDLRRLLGRTDYDLSADISTFMTASPRVVTADVSLLDAKQLFSFPSNISVLPVIERCEEKMLLLGVLTSIDTYAVLE